MLKWIKARLEDKEKEKIDKEAKEENSKSHESQEAENV